MNKALRLLVLLFFATFALVMRAQVVDRIRLDEPIQTISKEYVIQSLDKASHDGAVLVILQIDTPGGFVSAVEAIQRAILQSPVPVVAYVTPVNARAASGGALVALACDAIGMAPGTTIGSAHPVSALPFPIPSNTPLTPEGTDHEKDKQKQAEQDIMTEKILNDLSAHARSLADRRGRSAATYEKMLRESISLTEQEALKEGAIEFVANGEAQVLDYVRTHALKRFDGTEVHVQLGAAPDIRELGPTLRQKFLGNLANPNLTLLLLLLGVLGLYVEFKAPGLIFPGIIGGVCALLFALSTQMLPVNAVGLLLILLGVAFLVLELKVVSYGMLGIGGVASLFIGGLLLYRNSPIPELKVSLVFLVPVVLAFAGIILFLVTLAVRAFKHPVATGDEALMGQVGEVREAIEPPADGKVFLLGDLWNARCDRPLEKGRRVKVTSRHGMVLHVVPLEEGGP